MLQNGKKGIVFHIVEVVVYRKLEEAINVRLRMVYCCFDFNPPLTSFLDSSISYSTTYFFFKFETKKIGIWTTFFSISKLARLVFFIFSRYFLENCTYMTLVQFKSSKLTFRVGPVVLHVHPWNNIKLQEMDHLVSLRHGNTILIVLTLVLSR